MIASFRMVSMIFRQEFNQSRIKIIGLETPTIAHANNFPELQKIKMKKIRNKLNYVKNQTTTKKKKTEKNKWKQNEGYINKL